MCIYIRESKRTNFRNKTHQVYHLVVATYGGGGGTREPWGLDLFSSRLDQINSLLRGENSKIEAFLVPFDKMDKQSVKYTPYWEVFPMYVIKAGLNQDTISQIVPPPPPKEKEIKSKICPSIGDTTK